MTELLFIATLSCPVPLLVGGPFTDPLGKRTLARAQQVCLEQYNGCLVRLERYDLRFRALCRRHSEKAR